MWGGLVIGNIEAGSHLMIERYLHHRDAHEEATYGWGYIISSETVFGGWFESTSCGWYPLQSNFQRQKVTRAVLVTPHTQHKPRCLPYDNNSGQLAVSKIMHQHGALNAHQGTPGLINMRTVKDCPLYLNFDKSLQTFTGKNISFVPAHERLRRRYIVEGPFTKAAVVHTNLNFDTHGYDGWFFTENNCLETYEEDDIDDYDDGDE